MGNQCCATGRDTKVKQKAHDRHLQRSDSEYRSGMKSRYKSGQLRGGDDCERFDRAFETQDIREMVQLLNSNQKIDTLDEAMHPWASDPQTVGALAATHLAILASSDNDSSASQETQGSSGKKGGKKSKSYRNEIRKCGGIPPLVRYLQSQEVDRNEAAVVALSFLSVDSSVNCQIMYDNDALQLLQRHLLSKKEGMRAATASTLRNIYVLNMDTRREFLGGEALPHFLRLLDDPPNSEADGESPNFDTQFEALFNVEDLVTVDDQVVPEFAHILKQAGILKLLVALEKSEQQDEEVREFAAEMRDRIEAAVPSDTDRVAHN
uniref:Nucleotide exchange factor Fes1 domain-containing protein n=1 Tax=Chromera velia CCMP2878 TaxID=1169474 RepID=A0A0G4HF67_9ALVE|eukprot:Cvel_6571.t1-p1 / transcript=Cvel_6571.t1 / gene=Cvel_6571 / organism=Chromera_velia_CCMP2878 / gene_product=hypothetical protein / transcript_product=hypothetical protein / location=Cvel_scaffold324:19864-21941(+) / protein_length=321 / sequence_SO=supercontig / SO=protein_coding / is_pseudo=false